MPENVSPLVSWSSFYIMVGSSAAALTGLMFVVITLVTGREATSREDGMDGISTFSTPTVLHFGAALLICALLVAPWHSLLYADVFVALVGLYGLAYVLRVAYRTKRLRMYRADLEDWVWYTVLPFVAYGSIFGGALVLQLSAAKALFAIAGGVVLLVFIGIRNAWDVVTFLAVGGPSK